MHLHCKKKNRGSWVVKSRRRGANDEGATFETLSKRTQVSNKAVTGTDGFAEHVEDMTEALMHVAIAAS